MEDRYQHIRSATGKLYYAGEVFLIDPLLAKKGVYPGFPMTKRSELFNPLTELPMPIEEILKDVTCVMVTHTHSDHWDLYAEAYIKKDLPIYVQHAADANFIRIKGFKNVKVLGRGMMQGKVKLTRTACQHASDSMLINPDMAELLDQSMGFVFEAEGHKKIYVAGDTIWNDYVEAEIKMHKPDICILNTGHAETIMDESAMIMGKEDILKCLEFHDKCKVIAVHMDAINHCMHTRAMAREFVKEKKIEEKTFIPEDGEIVKI